MILYAVSAHVIVIKGKGFTMHQVPTFLLNGTALGIVDEEHAQKIVESICNPTKDPNIEVHATAVEWREID